MKSTCWDTLATDPIIKSGQKDTEASITEAENHSLFSDKTFVMSSVDKLGVKNFDCG